MPVVPKYSAQPIAQDAFPNVRVSTSAPLEAFGGNAKAPEAAIGALNVVDKIAMEEKRKADEVAHLAADRQASELQTQLQIGVGKLQGRDAPAAPDYLKAEWEKGLAKIQESLANDSQRNEFTRTSSKRWEELNKYTQFHMASQQSALDDSETLSYLETSRQSAALNFNDDEKIENEIGRQAVKLEEWAKRKGLIAPDGQMTDTYKAKLSEQLSSTDFAVITARLDAGRTQEAQAYFEKNKSRMAPKDLAAAHRSIENATTLNQAVETWQGVSSFKLPDGSPDQDKMQNAIMSRPDLSLEKKEKIWDYVKTRSAEEHKQKNDKAAAQTHAFTNAVLSAKSKGHRLDEVLKYVSNYGGDEVEQHNRAEIAKKLYTTEVRTNPEAKMAIWDQIMANPNQASSVGRQLVVEAYKNEQLSGSDFEELMKLTYNTQHREEESIRGQIVNDLAEEAKSKYGNKEKVSNYRYMLLMASRGKTPQETRAIGRDLLKSEGSLWWKEENWEKPKKDAEASQVIQGKLYLDLGRDVANAIGNPNQVEDFAKQLGLTYADLKRGTLANQAIEKIKKKNKKVTPDRVKQVMENMKAGSVSE